MLDRAVQGSKLCFQGSSPDADTGLQGYISAEEFMSIPELSINPLAHRLERMFETVNFKASPAAVQHVLGGRLTLCRDLPVASPAEDQHGSDKTCGTLTGFCGPPCGLQQAGEQGRQATAHLHSV